MAEVEDYADFGSHFLDSMLEVEMTEEDGEVDVSAPGETSLNNTDLPLPHTPTFDLQSEQYDGVYRNPFNPLTVLQPGPMLTIQSRELLTNFIPAPKIISTQQITIPNLGPNIKVNAPVSFSQNPKIVKLSTTRKPTLVTGSASSTTNSLTSTKIVPTSSLPIVTSSRSLSKTSTEPPVHITSEKLALRNSFLEVVFKTDIVKKVFEAADPPHEITHFSSEEMMYYRETFVDVHQVELCTLHCTICDKHLGCGSDVEKKFKVHNMLQVLTCKSCFEFYGDGNFPCDAVDNCEIYCRWCGQGGALVCCSFCPRVFCKKCVRRNFGVAFLKLIEKAKDWACFCCAQKPLWPHRAICRALNAYIGTKKLIKGPSGHWKDFSACCLPPPKKKLPERMKLPPPPPPPHMIKVNSVPKNNVVVVNSNLNKKILLATKPISRTGFLKPGISQFRISDQNKSPINTRLKNQSINSFNRFSKASVLKSYNASPTTRTLNIVSAQNIQAPVYHGQTLITPPASRLAIPPLVQRTTPVPAPAPAPATKQPPFVKVTLSKQYSNVDVNKIPVAKIPHNVQGLILRINFPDNKVQLVRLVTDGTGCNGFNIPEFKKENVDFLEGCVEDSFKLTKSVYDRLMLVKEKLKNKTPITEESVYNASVKKLHSAFEKARELFKELDDTMLEYFEDWKKEREPPLVELVDLSEDENKNKNTTQKGKSKKYKRSETFLEKSKGFLANDDSDIEIIEDDPKDSNEANQTSTNEGKEESTSTVVEEMASAVVEEKDVVEQEIDDSQDPLKDEAEDNQATDEGSDKNEASNQSMTFEEHITSMKSEEHSQESEENAKTNNEEERDEEVQAQEQERENHEGSVNGIENECHSDESCTEMTSEAGEKEGQGLSESGDKEVLTEADMKEKYQIKEFSIDLVKLPILGRKRKKSSDRESKRFRESSPGEDNRSEEGRVSDGEDELAKSDEETNEISDGDTVVDTDGENDRELEREVDEVEDERDPDAIDDENFNNDMNQDVGESADENKDEEMESKDDTENHDEIECKDDSENHDEMECKDDAENHDEIECKDDTENHDEMESKDDTENHDEAENKDEETENTDQDFPETP